MMDRFRAAARRRLRGLLAAPAAGATRTRRALHFLFVVGQRCVAALRRDQAALQAAALTYHTLFSLLPMTVLVLVALNGFVGAQGRDRLTKVAADWTIGVLRPDVPSIPGGAGTPAASGDDAGRAPSTPEEEFDAVRSGLQKQFNVFLNRLENVDLAGVGALGVLVFVWAATGLLGTVESSFNRIVGAASGRKWYVRIPLYYTAVTLGPLVLLAGIWLRGQVFNAVAAGSWSAWLAGPAWAAAQLVSTWLVVYLVYILLPAGPVGKKAAAVGSLVAAVLFLAARDLFGLYVTRGILGSLYGALALLPLFLLLILIIWLIVLFGLELTVVLEAVTGSRTTGPDPVRTVSAFDAIWVVPLAARVAEAFEKGRVSTVGDLSRDIGLADGEVRRLLNRLESADMVRRVEDGEREGYVLARPAARVSLPELLRAGAGTEAVADPAAGEREAPPSAGAWVRQLLTRSGWMEEGTTLRDVAHPARTGPNGSGAAFPGPARNGLSD